MCRVRSGLIRVKEFLTVLYAVLPVFCIAGIGVVMRLINWLTEEADASLLRVTVNLLIPCLIFDSILGNPALGVLSNVVLAPMVGLFTVVLGIVIAYGAGAGLAGEPARRRTFSFAVGVYNYGYVPLPLALALFDRETAGVLFVHNVGVEAGLWTFGLLLLSGTSWRESWRKLLNPPLIVIVFTLALNFLGLDEAVPGFVRTTTRMLGQCAIPVGLILIGATVADFRGEFRAVRGRGEMALACLLRLGVLPVLFLLLAKYLPCSIELKRVIVLEAAMPAAVFPIVIAKHYGGDTAVALRVVISTSVVGLITIPLWIRFGMNWVGL